MNDLEKMAEDAAEAFAKLEDVRNTAIAGSRATIRSTKKVIHAIHAGAPYEDAEKEMDFLVRKLVADVKDEPRVSNSPDVEDAMGEYCEAKILISVVRGAVIPSPKELGVSWQAWVLGLCDSLGELRRLLLTKLMNSDTEYAKKLFASMEAVSDVIMTFDVPDAILPVRRKQDIARGIMDRTRSDLTAAVTVSKRY